ncbi:hypothetical protein [Komagataeibacter sp. FNDCF1]|uniref:hypothetical protein n=1 Tax=Komagataeibacter sp. FNDCF1 TaxID=2878681 RepID=UPI001E48EF8F|nr:hypothetical protein [Komagataeibacter sp. FNDCF1]MCE2566444.1 hypothetical protein [Komagataeibacter sp. FNDCF1]
MTKKFKAEDVLFVVRNNMMELMGKMGVSLELDPSDSNVVHYCDSTTRLINGNAFEGSKDHEYINYKFTVDELASLPDDVLWDFRFYLRDKEKGFYLLPLWVFPRIKDGEVLQVINGETMVVDHSDKQIDLAIRCGCVAYGFFVKREKKSE